MSFSKSRILLLSFLLIIFCASRAEAISKWISLSERIEKSELIIIGTMVAHKDIPKEVKDKISSSVENIGRIYTIKVKKILLGRRGIKKISIFQKHPFSTEGPIYFENREYLLFLERMESEIIQKYELPEITYYETIFDSNQCALNLAHPRNLEEVQATKEFIKIRKIKSRIRKILAYKKALKNENEVLKWNARIELNKTLRLLSSDEEERMGKEIVNI
jgi:hypothetical protein